MKKLKILIDYDDTLFPLIPRWTEALNKAHGYNVIEAQVKEWDISKNYPTLTWDDILKPLEDDEFWFQGQPVKDGFSSLSALHEHGHVIQIATATPFSQVKSKMEVLFHYFPFITKDNVFIAKHKQQISADVLIDDAPHNLVGGSYKKILINRPHNESFYDIIGDIYRVNNLTEATDLILRGWCIQ